MIDIVLPQLYEGKSQILLSFFHEKKNQNDEISRKLNNGDMDGGFRSTVLFLPAATKITFGRL